MPWTNTQYTIPHQKYACYGLKIVLKYSLRYNIMLDMMKAEYEKIEWYVWCNMLRHHYVELCKKSNI